MPGASYRTSTMASGCRWIHSRTVSDWKRCTLLDALRGRSGARRPPRRPVPGNRHTRRTCQPDDFGHGRDGHGPDGTAAGSIIRNLETEAKYDMTTLAAPPLESASTTTTICRHCGGALAHTFVD